MQIVTLETGEEIEFEDDVSDAEIKAILKSQNTDATTPSIQPPVYDPTTGMSNYELFMAGMGKAVSDTGFGIQQLLGMVTPEEVAARERRDAPLMNTGVGTAGNIGGHMAMFALPGGVVGQGGKAATALGATKAGATLAKSAKLLSGTNSVKNAAGAGAVYGGLQPGDKITNTLLGGLGGAGGQALTKALSSTVAPKISNSVRGLLDQGVELTPGSIIGGAAKRAEDASTSIPIVGDMIIRSQNRSLETFNRAAWNRVLEPLGKSLPDDVPVGREAMAWVDDTLSSTYDKLLPKLSGKLDDELVGELRTVSEMVQTLTDEQIGQFNRIMDRSFYQHFTDFGLASGESIKRVESEIGKKATKMRVSSDPKISEVGDALTEVLFSTKRMLERQNPAKAPELQKVNRAWATMLRPERASSFLGAEEGIFSPANLQNAVKTLEPSKRKFARGEALMQDLSEPAKSILPSVVRDSGTPFRLANMATAAAAAGSSSVTPAIPAFMAGAAGLYTRPAQKVIRGLLAHRPEGAALLANQVDNMGPLFTAAGTSGLLAAP